jgi:hypothetical protein
MTMALMYKSLYSTICILPTYFLDLGYISSLYICQILKLYNYNHFGLTLFLSFFLEERSWYTYQRQALYSIAFLSIFLGLTATHL